MVHSFIESKLAGLSSIFRQHKVKKSYLFGSACTEAFSDVSDVDFLIEPGDEADPVVKGENLWDLYYALKHCLGRDVDMITRESLVGFPLIRRIQK